MTEQEIETGRRWADRLYAAFVILWFAGLGVLVLWALRP